MQCRWSLSLLFLLSGCFIVLDGGEDDDPPDERPPVIDAGQPCFPTAPPLWLRDPYTAGCVNFGGTGEPSCPQKAGPLPVPIPPYPECETECNPLDERACLETPGCRGFYAGQAQAFAACYAASGYWDDPARPCEQIVDPYECGGREDCSSWHAELPGEFLACLSERVSTPARCEGLDEATCIDYVDGCAGDATCAVLFCEPLYEGVGCACSPEGCSCQDWAYVGCRSQG